MIPIMFSTTLSRPATLSPVLFLRLNRGDSNPLTEVGDYRCTTGPNGIRLNTNGFTFETNPAAVDFLIELVNNYQNLDNYAVLSYNNLFSICTPGSFVMNIITGSSTILPRRRFRLPSCAGHHRSCPTGNRSSASAS